VALEGAILSMTTTLMTVLAAVLLALWLLTSIVNWIAIVNWCRRGKRNSMILVAGGVFAIAGCLMWPGLDGRWGIALVVLDPGCFVIPAICYPFDKRRRKT
jgi:hypothetical protein